MCSLRPGLPARFTASSTLARIPGDSLFLADVHPPIDTRTGTFSGDCLRTVTGHNQWVGALILESQAVELRNAWSIRHSIQLAEL